MFSVYPFPCDDWENIYTLSYYHHQIGSMNYYPLFRVRSWNNGMRCMFLYILIMRHGNSCVHRWIGFSLVQVLAWRHFELKFMAIHPTKIIWIFCLQNINHFSVEGHTWNAVSAVPVDILFSWIKPTWKIVICLLKQSIVKMALLPQSNACLNV